MDLLVGCPAVRRGWILRRWAEHIDVAADVAGAQARFIVLADRDDDAWAALEPVADRLVRVDTDDERDRDERDWPTPGRLERIVELRNMLLGAVRIEAPDMFLSVDSDILLHPRCIANLLETAVAFDAVGGYTYMSETRGSPSWGRLLEGGALDRVDVPGYVGAVEVIMAIKAMSPKAYAVDYQRHDKGEDVGICLAWRTAGVTIGLDARVTSKHVMDRARELSVDERCGF